MNILFRPIGRCEQDTHTALMMITFSTNSITDHSANIVLFWLVLIAADNAVVWIIRFYELRTAPNNKAAITIPLRD